MYALSETPAQPQLLRQPEPQDPPDKNKVQTFKEILMGKSNTLNQVYDLPDMCDMEVENRQEENPNSIILTKVDHERLHALWKSAVIIKVSWKAVPPCLSEVS